MQSMHAQGTAGQGQPAVEFFNMMIELPVQLDKLNDRRKVQAVADTIDQICSTVFQQFGITPRQISPSPHRPRWQQIPHMSEQTATRADQLTEFSQNPIQHAPGADSGQVDRTFNDANDKLRGALSEAGIPDQSTSTRYTTESGAGRHGGHGRDEQKKA